MLNKLFIEGRLTRNPYVNDKKTVVMFTLAQDTGYKDKKGNKITNFVSLKAFGEGLVDVIGDYCLKGDLISVEAHATTENNNGNYSTALIVDNMHFLTNYVEKEEEEEEGPKPKSRRR